MTAIKQIPIWNKTKFTGLNPDFDYEAKKLGYENLNHVAKQYEKYGYDTFHFCTLSADYKDLKTMISFFNNIEKNNEKYGISMKWYIKRIKSESRMHMKIDKMYRMVLLRVFLKDDKDYKWMQKNLA
jgi:hypothetical protein